MEASYIDVLRSARIVDLQDSSATTLPDTNQLVALGEQQGLLKGQGYADFFMSGSG